MALELLLLGGDFVLSKDFLLIFLSPLFPLSGPAAGFIFSLESWGCFQLDAHGKWVLEGVWV